MEWLLRLSPGELAGADSLSPRFAAAYNNWIILALGVVLLGLAALTVVCYLRLSMSLKDRYADPALRARLAGKLGVGAERLAEMTRSEVVRAILARQGGPLAELARDHPLVILRFSTSQPGREAYTRQLAVVDRTGSPRGVGKAAQEIAEALGGLSAGGYDTNLPAALRDAAERLQGRLVAGIVLVSDGQMTSGAAPADRLGSALTYLRHRGIPVFAVGVGDPHPPRNVAVLRLQGPAEVRQGSTIELTAYLTHRNCGGRQVQLRLLRKPVGRDQWTDTGLSESVRLEQPAQSAPGRTQEVVLRAEADALGEYVYKAEVGALEGEFSTADNAATAKVRISEEKIKVLLVGGYRGWEFHYLRNFLLRSPDRYAVSVWQQDADLQFNQEASTGMRLSKLPRTPPELFEYEVVILYDPAYTQGGFDQQFVEMLEGFVGDHHGGLCYVAGNKYTDTNLSARSGPFAALAALLPVELGRRTVSVADRIARTEPTAWQVMPTAVGRDHPVLRLSERGDGGVWRALPGVYWFHPVARLKPLASSLAISTDPMNRTADGSGQPAPLIAVQYYGKGRSLFIGFDESWRWRFLADGAYHRRFWSNVVDFLAAGRLESKRVIITTGGDRFAVGETLPLRVEAYARDYKPLGQESFVVEMINRTTKQVRKITLGRDPDERAPGHYAAAVPLTDVGEFELTALRDDPTYKDDVAGKTITVTLPEQEFRHPEADLATLRTIAPEGRFVMVHEADKLGELIPSGKMSVFYEVPHELWDAPLAMAVIVILLACEWILRKKYNMA